MARTDCRLDLVVPDEYFNSTIRSQLWSLLDEDALKDTTIALRGISVTMNSFVLSLLSPMLRKMVCGNFRERICKDIGLDDVVAERLLKLLQLACGKEGIVVKDVEELFELGELAERLQMVAVRSEIGKVHEREKNKIKKDSVPLHGESRLMTHSECKNDLLMPNVYFSDVIRPQMWSLLEENALKDTTIKLRASSITVNSFVLSLLSPVLRKMVCGNSQESVCKEIGLDGVEAERLSKLLQLAGGKEGLVAKDVEELLELGELAERLQMVTVRSGIEDTILKELRMENCLAMLQRSEAIGLDFLREECCNMLRDNFGVISQQQGFLKLSEVTLGALLEEDELGVKQEEEVFEAVRKWLSNIGYTMRGGVNQERLLRRIRYGVMSSEYLADLRSSASLPGHGMMKELVGEAMAKKAGAGGEGMWDGMKRLCDKWMVARGMKGRFIGADVLKGPRCVAMDGQGRIVVSDMELHKIIVFNHDGSVARRFPALRPKCRPKRDAGVAAPGQFDRPMGVAVDRQGHIVVADGLNHRIQVLKMDGSVARCFGSEGTAVGQLKGPQGVAIDGEGHIVVADNGNHRIQVFDEDGSVVSHFGSLGDAIGQLELPTGVAVDGAGRIVFADWGNHRVQVFNSDGSVALCFGSLGDGPGQLKFPHGVAVDSAGRFVVSDTSNYRLQVFNSDGSAERVIGSKGTRVGELSQPLGVVVDGAGRIIVAEGMNHRVQVL